MTKSIFFITFCILLSKGMFAQKDTATYYIKKSGYIVSTKDSADFLLTISAPDTNVDKDLYIVKEYYPNRKIRFTSTSRTNKLKAIDPKYPSYFKPILQGACISFFPNGHKMKIENYENGEPVGNETEYYPSGKLYCNKTYSGDKKLLCNKCIDSTGKVLVENGNGKWLTFIDEDFKNYIEGQVINGLEEGEWFGKQNDTLNLVG
jgi:antitoxin component YwqK of YwqJK toxin-antitoxin module